MVAPTVVEVVTYYGVLFAWCGRWFTRRRTGLVLAVVVALIGLRVARQGGAEITVLSQSTNSVFCDLPGSAGDLLIDCGRSHGVARVVIPFVHSRGLSSVPRLLLTHGDAGHVEGFKLVMTELRPGQVSISGVEQRSVAYRAAVAAVAVPDIVSRGDRIGPWQVLHPAYPQGGVATADDVAVTLRGEIEGIRVMIMPDASRVAQLAMLERWADLGAEVLIVGCPREGEEILEDFLLRVAPETIVLQDNWTPAYDRANGALLRRLHCFANNVRAVSRHGSVTIRLQDGAYSMVSISGLSK